jgi:hypothetical protein
MSLALENRTKNGYLTNLKHGRCFAGACFPEPAGVVYNVVRAFIYYDNGKIPFQHINRRPEPVFAIQLDNQQFYRHVLADELRKRTGAVDTGFFKTRSRSSVPCITTTLLKINILFKYPSDIRR